MNNEMTIAEFQKFAHDQIRKQDLTTVKQALKNMTAAEILGALLLCSEHDAAVLFRLLEKNTANEVFDIMDASVQGELIESFTRDEALRFIAELDPDDQVKLLDELPAKVAKRFLEGLPKEQRTAASRLMGYADDTVGRIMSPVYLQAKKNQKVAEALESIRAKNRSLETAVHTVYIIDETRHLEGVLPLSTLVLADTNMSIGDLLPTGGFDAVHTGDDQETAARLLQRLDVVELPVLDGENRLVGVLTADDAMDVIREETTDDMFDKVGLLDITKRESDRSHRLIHGSFFHVLAVRVPFLLITLAGGMLAGAVIDAFEEILEAVVATAIFIPVIMDMGGNVGTQSSTIFTRAMVLGQINMRKFLLHWLREVLHGAGMGVILGALGGFVAALWQGMPELGLAVGISLAATITIGIGLGFLVPYVLIKLGFDQAAGADPIITTIKDMSGLVIYFFSVAFFLPQIVL